MYNSVGKWNEEHGNVITSRTADTRHGVISQVAKIMFYII